jgi:hypothetical protein
MAYRFLSLENRWCQNCFSLRMNFPMKIAEAQKALGIEVLFVFEVQLGFAPAALGSVLQV